MIAFINWLLGYKRVLVKEHERLLTLYKGEVTGIISAGEHWLVNKQNRLLLDYHDIDAKPYFHSRYEKALFAKCGSFLR